MASVYQTYVRRLTAETDLCTVRLLTDREIQTIYALQLSAETAGQTHFRELTIHTTVRGVARSLGNPTVLNATISVEPTCPDMPCPNTIRSRQEHVSYRKFCLCIFLCRYGRV